MSTVTALIAPIMVNAMIRRAGVGIGGEPIDSPEYVRAFLEGRAADGFTFKIHGIPAWVRTNDDGAFATEIGLRWAPPRLRRLMAAHARPAERHPALT